MEKFKSFFTAQNKMRIAMILGILGIALIVLSQYISFEEKQLPHTENEVVLTDLQQELEDNIKSIVSAITGESQPIVMLTLKNSSTYVYATQDKDTSAQNNNENNFTTEVETEKNYIITEDENGNETAILLNEVYPEIKGVVVVSIYAHDIVLKEAITNAVMTALDISSNEVCVVPKYN